MRNRSNFEFVAMSQVSVTKKDLIRTLTLTTSLLVFSVTVTAHGTPLSSSVPPVISQSTNQYLLEL